MIQIASTAPPLDSPEASWLALRVLTLAEGMGLLRGMGPIRRLDRGVLERVARNASASGIGRDVLARLRSADRPERIEPALRQLYEALERSPAPAAEWRVLLPTLGPDLLSELLGISASSIRRYATASRRTPDQVAERLHHLALVVSDLVGSYNDLGIRRWFVRPRVQLDGRSPRQLLKGDWKVDSEGAVRVRDLAFAATAPLGT